MTARSQEKDPKKQAELDKKMKVLSYEQHEHAIARKINDKAKPAQIEALISGEKTIDQVVEQLRKEDKSFDLEYKKWEKEKAPHDNDEKKKKAPKEETDGKPKSSET